MGEAKRRIELGAGHQQQIQVHIDPAKDKPLSCDCGCVYFHPAIMLYPISAIHPRNPTGQEITAQQGVLVCLGCRMALK